MPSPIGHALGGLIVGLGTAPARAPVPRRYLAMCAVAACVPDLDFAWGRHNMETHSLGFAIVAGLAVYAVDRLRGRASGRLAIACALAVASHVLFDWLGSDDTPPLGVMALWPFSSDFYFAHAMVFDAISRRYWLPGFLAHNAWAVAKEILILGPVAAVLWWPRSRRT